MYSIIGIAFILCGIGMSGAIIGFFVWMLKKISSNQRKQAFLVMGTIAVLLLGYGMYRYCSIERDGMVGVDVVRFGDVEYIHARYDISKEGKTIGKVDGFQIKEIPEDPKHNFLAIRSFLDQAYLVRKDYKIPVSGKVSCCYVRGKRSEDEELLQTMGEILSIAYDDGFQIETEKKPDRLCGVSVGYDECPVGTDVGYMLGCLDDGRWVLVFRKDYTVKDGIHTIICHEITKEQEKILENSGMFQ